MRFCFRHTNLHTQIVIQYNCVVPENIHTLDLPVEDLVNSEGERILKKESMKLNWNFQRGAG